MKATITPIRLEGSHSATVVEARSTFFDRVDLAEGTARKYRHSLTRLVERHGKELIAAVGADELTVLLEDLAGQATGQTWNRHRAALAPATSPQPTVTLTAAAPVSATAGPTSCSRRRPAVSGPCISCAIPAYRTSAAGAWTCMP